MKKLLIFSDGGARGNPGPGGIGIIFCDEKGKVLKKISKFIGETTNNQAEYKALIEAIKTIKKFPISNSQFLIICFLDAELVVKQLNGEYRVKDADLKPLYEKVKNLSKDLNITFKHIPRKKNKLADKLVNMAIDKKLSR